MTSVDRVASTAREASAPLLRVRELAITHEGADAATPCSVSFDVAPGEVVLVLGPSGSGKSTLALALNGLIPHALPATVEGSVVVAGMTAAETPVAVLSTHVGMVFQDPDAQLVTGTLLDEVAFGVENLRRPVDEVMRRTEQALRRVGLWERRVENPDRLSGGGRQRLAIACALAMGSPLLVLDEPTANLDPAGIEDVYAALADLVAAGDRAIVLVEHDLDAAIGFVDRVVVLDGDGCLVLDGPAQVLLRDRAEELHALGVWLPVSTLAALRLRRAGYALEPLPLTPGELRAALAASPPRTVRSGRTPALREDDSAPSVLPGRTSPPQENGTATDVAALIAVRGLSVSRSRREVLHDVSLDIRRGDFLAVVGENGAGKTTLVQAIAGVVPPPRGRVLVDGIDPGRAPARELARHIGFVFQNPEHQFLAHTVFDELAHGLRLRHLPEDEVRDRVADLLERFGLSDKAQTHPFLLSGGQKRRLSVGTALIAGAPVLALDEPTFGQDRERADELLGILDELHRDGTTVIVVTHDMQLVAEHATHTALVSGGRLLAHAPTAEVFADRELIESAGLRVPPLAAALAGIRSHPELDGIVRLRDLPGGRTVTAETVATPQRAAFDPYAPAPATAPIRFLYRLNPLAKLAAPIPAIVVLVFVRDMATPLSFLLLAYALLLVGARLTWRALALLVLGVPAGVAVLGLGLALWTDAARVDQSVVVWQLGGWTMYGGALAVGFATALRLAAILALSLIAGLTTTGPDLVRSFVQQLRVPYRVGYTALAAFRFVPRFRHELEVIRAAHRVRGSHSGRGPFAAVARWIGYVVPLLAGAIRHAERVALAMDARAFGAHPTRTERYLVPFRARDVVFIVLFCIVSAALLWYWFPWQLG